MKMKKKPEMKALKDPEKEQKKNKAAAQQSAIDILKEDHRQVKALFDEFKRLAKTQGGKREKRAIVRQVCDMLDVHARIEEGLFYPVVRRALEEQDIMNEALVEHDCAMDLVDQLRRMSPEDELFDAKFIVLGEQVRHHIKEEEQKMFPKVRKTRLDLARLGADLARFKRELEEDMNPAARQDDRFFTRDDHAAFRARQGGYSASRMN